MKKLIPVVIAIILIVLVVGVGFGAQIIEKYTYSQERADLNEYFNIYDSSFLPVILQDTITKDHVKMVDQVCYMDSTLADLYFGVEFYFDKENQTILYTTATEIIKTVVGSNEYTKGGEIITVEKPIILPIEEDGIIYISLDYLKNYATFSYEVFPDPARVQIYSQWEERNVADLNKNSAIRYQGGIKSPILEDVQTGDTVVILEEMENWSKVKSSTGIIGYVENKYLENHRAEALTPVEKVELPVFESTLKDYRICLGWHQVGGTGGNATLGEMIANTTGLNTISPTWFSLSDNDGNFNSFAEQSYVDYAHKKGIEVWGLIDDFNSNIDLFTILSKSESRSNLIQNLVDVSLKYELDGINIDFENVSGEASTHFIQFIRELSIPCRENNIVLSIDNYVPREYTNHYNRQQQGIYADYVIIMGYDEHWANSPEAGSVASIDFVEDGIAQTLKEVPKEKVINGIPFYTRIWTTDGAEVSSDAVGMQLAEEWVSNHNLTANWDEATCQNYAEYEENGKTYQVWLEDASSIEVKLSIMNKYEIAGVAAWKLGFEKPSIWDVINAYVLAY